MTPSNRMPRQRRAIAPALDDPVRIVPLHAPREVFAPAAGIAAPPSPQLTYRGGPLLGAVQVFTVFWGAAWNDAPQLSTAQSLNRFLQVVVASPYVDQLAEYGTDRQAIGRGRYVGTATVPDSLGTNVTDSAIRHMLQQQLTSGSGVPAPTPDTLYFVFLPTRFLPRAGTTTTTGRSATFAPGRTSSSAATRSSCCGRTGRTDACETPRATRQYPARRGASSLTSHLPLIATRRLGSTRETRGWAPFAGVSPRNGSRPRTGRVLPVYHRHWLCARPSQGGHMSRRIRVAGPAAAATGVRRRPWFAASY